MSCYGGSCPTGSQTPAFCEWRRPDVRGPDSVHIRSRTLPFSRTVVPSPSAPSSLMRLVRISRSMPSDWPASTLTVHPTGRLAIRARHGLHAGRVGLFNVVDCGPQRHRSRARHFRAASGRGAARRRSRRGFPGQSGERRRELEPGFGGGSGYASTDFFGLDDQANGVALQADGSIVAVGYASASANQTLFALARYVGGNGVAPVITTQPQSQTVAPSQPFSVTVAATGTAPLSTSGKSVPAATRRIRAPT